MTGISGLHPYLPCERCFRMPPGTRAKGAPRTEQAPYCHCVPEDTYAKVEQRYLENLQREEATKVWKFPIGQAAA